MADHVGDGRGNMRHIGLLCFYRMHGANLRHISGISAGLYADDIGDEGAARSGEPCVQHYAAAYLLVVWYGACPFWSLGIALGLNILLV